VIVFWLFLVAVLLAAPGAGVKVERPRGRISMIVSSLEGPAGPPAASGSVGVHRAAGRTVSYIGLRRLHARWRAQRESPVVAQQGPQHINQPASQCQQRLRVDTMLAAFAVVEGP
jgi:hypothetical protein